MPSFDEEKPDKDEDKDIFPGKRGKRSGDGNYQPAKRLRYYVGARVKGVEVGITEYIGNHPGFKGTIKERYSDFHVNEISLTGEVAVLTDITVPKILEEAEFSAESLQSIPTEIIAQLEALKIDPDPEASTDVDVKNLTKSQRTAIHELARKIMNVTSKTVTKAGTKVIKINKLGNNRKNKRDTRVDWSKRDGKYCHFLMHKVNIDTMGALQKVASRLRVKVNCLTFNGNKDRRANTTQGICLKRGEPRKIMSCTKSLRNIHVGNFKFSTEKSNLGNLYGNRFRLALRNLEGTEEDIERAMVSLRDKGFINYYGLQRFGTVADVPTYIVGKALMLGKWTEAIDLILKPREEEKDRAMREARRIYYETKDAALAYKKIRNTDSIEGSLLRGLLLNGKTNPQGALNHIPKNAMLMYLHSYQSYIWNHVASKRIKEFGDKPIVGDFVFESTESAIDMEDETEVFENEADDPESMECHTGEDENVPLTDPVEENKTSKHEENKEAEMDLGECKDKEDILMENGNKEDSGKVEEKVDESQDVPTDGSKKSCGKIEFHGIPSKVERKNEEKVKEETLSAKEEENLVENVASRNVPEDAKRKNKYSRSRAVLPQVRILKEEDLPNYTLADVIMPLPGRKVIYPSYAKSWYDELLGKDDLTTDMHSKNRKYILWGTYRKILEIPRELSWEIMRYNDKMEDLLLSDLDVLENRKAPENDPEGIYKALIIKMSLKSSVYATMALREILRCDTSSEMQAFYSAKNNEEE